MKSGTKKIRILIADDQIMFREALRHLLEQEADLCVVGEAADGEAALSLAERLAPDILLLDLVKPQASGMETLRRLAQAASKVRAIIFDDSSDEHRVIEALKLGARGVMPIHTSADLLYKGIRSVAAGEYWVEHRRVANLIDSLRTAVASEREPGRASANDFHLTTREIDIVTSIVDGYTNKEIAKKFAISEQTVKHHLTNIFDKVGVANRLELALVAMHQTYAA